MENADFYCLFFTGVIINMYMLCQNLLISNKYVGWECNDMACFVGSNPHTNNWGEDYVIQKFIEYFDDSCIVYRNREIFGTQFDICVLIPDQGIAVVEVKAWKPTTIQRVENGDQIIIKTSSGEEVATSPIKQARGYVFALRNRVRQRTRKTPFVFPLVCFPQLTISDYQNKHLAPVCEIETTILKEDLENKAALYNKMNLAMRNGQRSLSYCNPFNKQLMLQVRQLFESELDLKNLDKDSKEKITRSVPLKIDVAYSLFYFCQTDGTFTENEINNIVQNYLSGTKIIVVVREQVLFERIVKAISSGLQQQGLQVCGENLKLCLNGDQTKTASKLEYRVFNCLVCLADNGLSAEIPSFCVTDGKAENEIYKQHLREIGKHSSFNSEQYEIEHADASKNILIRAGAGTGKTFTMISRIGFLCRTQSCNVQDMANRIVMITFTNDAANQMKEKIKGYFNNFYLLTGNVDYLRFVGLIDDMQISTIHAYAKHLISLLGMEIGYGIEVSVTSGEYRRKQIVAEKLDQYLTEKSRQYGNSYTAKLGQPVYAIRDNILNFINHLHNQSVDVQSLDAASFGELTNGEITEGEKELHELFSVLVPSIERAYSDQLLQENQIHLSTMMSVLRRCLQNSDNVERLKKMQTGTPQFMFVDEFQDTDDVQIEGLKRIAELLQYRLFVVGDIKQCIYRFRGAKEKAFDQLHISAAKEQWLEFSLTKNFRTDARLLGLFDKSFSTWGSANGNDDPLLVYDSQKDKLIGTRFFNETYSPSKFYKAIHVSDERDLMGLLFEEVKRQIARIKDEEERGIVLDKKEKEIAILVRENWQADLIRQEAKRRNMPFEIITNTGGDLYRMEPALDMLTLANALLHYDEADYLYAFVASNFIGGGASKAYMYQLRQKQKGGWRQRSKVTDTDQAKELQRLIDRKWDNSDLKWNKVVQRLRTQPVMQVMRAIYSDLKPWDSYGGDRNYYRQNVDLLFEQLMATCNLDVLTINSLVDVLLTNIRSCKNVDSRNPTNDSNGNPIVVRSITVHKSKGLEYGAVILPYCSYAINRMKKADLHISTALAEQGYQIGYQIKAVDNQTFQNNFFDVTAEKAEREREEMRILYVAMTRAIRSFSWFKIENKNTMSWQKMIWEGNA